MRRAITVLAAIAMSACVYAEESGPGIAPIADPAQPRLALMDHLLGNYFASDAALDAASGQTVCATTHDGRSEVALPADQEQALIARYETLTPFAQCGWIDDAWQDTDSGEPATVFNIHSFTCANADHCTGFGGYAAGQTASMSQLYTMRFADGAWGFEVDRRLLGER